MMAEQDEIIRQTYALEIDEQRLSRLKAGIAEARKAIDSTTAAIKAQPLALSTAGSALDQYGRKIDTSDFKVTDATDNLRAMVSELFTLEDASKSAATAQDELAMANQRVAQSVKTGSGAGTAASNLSGTRQLLGAVGGIANQIAPGTGQAFSIVGDITETVKDFPKLKEVISDLNPAVIASAAAIGTAIAAFEVGNAVAKDNTAAIRDVTGRTKEYYQLLVDGTSDAISAKIKEVQLEQQIAQKRVDDLAFVAQGYDELHNKLGVISAPIDAIIETAGALGAKNFADIREARIAYDQANQDLKKANDNLALFNSLLDSNATATNNAAAAVRKAQDEYAKNIVASIEGPLKAQAEYQSFISTATTEDLDKRRKAAADAKELTAQEIVALETRKSSAEAGSKAYEALQTEIDTLYRQYNDQVDAYDRLTSSSAKATAAENTLAQIREKQLTAVKKYDNDLDAIDQKDYEARAGIAQRYSDTLVKIAEGAATAAENALQKLSDQRDKLAQDLARADATAEQQAQMQSLNEQIKFQQQSARSAREHARELAQIQRDAQKNEQKLIDDRDFAGLFEARQGVASAIQVSNEKYDQERADALEAYAQQNEDRNRQFEFETEQRHKKFQQDNADAQAAYNKELQQANRARQAALDAAAKDRDRQYSLQSSKYSSELNLRKSAILSELSMIQAGNDMKLKADEVYIAQLRQLLGTMPAPNQMAATAVRGSGRVSPTRDFDTSFIRAGSGSSQASGAGKAALNFNAPLVNAPINVSGSVNAAQLNGIRDMIFDGALEALQLVTGVQVNK